MFFGDVLLKDADHVVVTTPDGRKDRSIISCERIGSGLQKLVDDLGPSTFCGMSERVIVVGVNVCSGIHQDKHVFQVAVRGKKDESLVEPVFWLYAQDVGAK